MGGESDQVTVYNSGSSISIPDGVGILYIDPSSLVATLSVTLPPNPADQQRFRIALGGTMTSGTIITLLTILPNTGQTILGTVSQLMAIGVSSMLFIYRTANSKWYRVQ